MGGPAAYQIQAAVLAKGGLLRSPQIFSVPPRSVRVWTDLARTRPVPSLPCQMQCLFTGDIYVGRAFPNGVRVQVSIENGRVEISAFTVAGISAIGGAVPGPEVSTGRWSVGPLVAFKSYHYTVMLRRRDDGKSMLNWNEFVPDVSYEE